MCRQQISYIDYVEAVEDIYKIERRETYFSFILRDFIQSVLSEDERLVAVWDNKGYGDSTKDPLHRRGNYADSRSLQDFIIVPWEYTYENTTKPYVSIELKMADLDKYKELESDRARKQLEAELRFCDYIIFTDCVTWIFITKGKNGVKEEKLCLIKEKKWLPVKSDDRNGQRMGDIPTEEPKEWKELKNKIRQFVLDAKKVRKDK